MEDEITVKILEIIKGVKEKAEGMESRQRELAETLRSLEDKVNGIAADAESGKDGGESVADIRRELEILKEKFMKIEPMVKAELKNIPYEKIYDSEKAVRRLDEDVRNAAEEIQRLKLLHGKMRLLELSLGDNFADVRKSADEISELRRAVEGSAEKVSGELELMKKISGRSEEKNREAISGIERREENIAKEFKRVSEAMEARINMSLKEIESAASRKSRKLNDEESELEKIKGRVSLVERKLGSERNIAELMISGIAEKNEARMGELRREFASLKAAMRAEFEKNLKAAVGGRCGILEDRVREIEEHAERMDGIEKSVENAEKKIEKVTGEIMSRQEKFLKDIMKGLG